MFKLLQYELRFEPNKTATVGRGSKILHLLLFIHCNEDDEIRTVFTLSTFLVTIIMMTMRAQRERRLSLRERRRRRHVHVMKSVRYAPLLLHAQLPLGKGL